MEELFKIYDDRYSDVSDKGTKHSYINFYEGLFLPFRDKQISLLEIGVQRGGSINLWSEYFVNAENVVGIDINDEANEEEKRKWESQGNISFIQGSSTDKNLLENPVIKNNKFDIIIDDGGHDHSTQMATFDNFYNKLNVGGVYVIEDIYRSSAWRFLKHHKDLDPIHLDFRKHKHFYPSSRGRSTDNQLIIFFKL